MASLASGVAPASGQENLGLCDADESRPPESTITEDLWYCFDGEILYLRNESALVFQVLGGREPNRRLEGWSPAGDEVVYGGGGGLSPEPIVPDNVLPPGYSLQLQIGPQREDVTIVVDPELSSTFAKEQLRTSFYGLIPGVGTIYGAVEAVHGYMDEMDESSIKHSDCQQRSRNFFQGAACNLIHKRDVSVAVGRGLIKGIPIVDDVPRMLLHIQRALKIANSIDEWAELTVDPLYDIGEWVEGKIIAVPGNKIPDASDSEELDCSQERTVLVARAAEPEWFLEVCWPGDSEPVMTYHIPSTGDRGSGPLCSQPGGDSVSEVLTGLFGLGDGQAETFDGEVLDSIVVYQSVDTSELMTDEDWNVAIANDFEELEWKWFAEVITNGWAQDDDWTQYEIGVEMDADLFATMDVGFCPSEDTDI